MQHKVCNTAIIFIFFILAVNWFMYDLMKTKGLSYPQKYKIFL